MVERLRGNEGRLGCVVTGLGSVVSRFRGVMRGRISVMGRSGIGDLGDESGIGVVDVIGDGLNPAVGQEHVVRPLRGVAVSRFVVAEIYALGVQRNR